MGYDWHRPLEAKGLTLTVLTLLAVLVGGLVELIPPYFLQGTVEPIEGVKPYAPLELEGRDIYIREGCNNCHSQMIRPFKTETDRYGPFTMAGENIYDRPFLYGSKRTGPDLDRVGGKYPDSWHWIHFRNPREIEPRSLMPAYAFLSTRRLDLSLTERKLEVLRRLGTPYSDDEIRNAVAEAQAQMQQIAAALRKDGIDLSDSQAHSETLALIAYMQRLGADIGWRSHPVQQASLAPGGAQ
jgi:cytochrome c oxidase cbb3-type subunit I/II